MCIGDRTNLSSNLQTDFADQRTSDGSPEQIYLFVLGLPGQHGKCEVAAEFLASIDHAGGNGATIASLLHGGFTVLTWLAEIDVDRMDLIALILKPAQNDRRIEAAGVSQYTTFHYDAFRENEDRP